MKSLRKTKPRIAIVIPCWGRPEILRITCLQLDIFYQKVIEDIELLVIYVLSKEDRYVTELEHICSNINHSSQLIYHNNNLLGNKLNEGITHAKYFDYDYIMNFGSDNLIHPDLIKLYLPYIKYKIPFIGISSLYFYKKGENPLFFNYYNNPYLVGAGRLIHKTAVTDVISNFGSLYNIEICRGMDTHSAKKLIACGYQPYSLYNGEFPYIVDIKSEVNINSFEKISQSARVTEVNSNIMNLEDIYPVLKLV